MKIVGVCACCSGIAHTYMAKEALIKAAQAVGDEIAIETQGTIGLENELTEDQIKTADVVILAIDVHIEGKDRFKNSKVLEIPTDIAIKAPKQIIQKIHNELKV